MSLDVTLSRLALKHTIQAQPMASSASFPKSSPGPPKGSTHVHFRGLQTMDTMVMMATQSQTCRLRDGYKLGRLRKRRTRLIPRLLLLLGPHPPLISLMCSKFVIPHLLCSKLVRSWCALAGLLLLLGERLFHKELRHCPTSHEREGEGETDMKGEGEGEEEREGGRG